MRLKQGTSIIEIVIAAALISVAVIAALSLANRSQKQNNYARNLDEATKYGSQAADWVRSEKSSLGWSTIAAKVAGDAQSNSATYCLSTLPNAESATDFTDLPAGPCADYSYLPNTLFTRQMTVDTTSMSSGTLRITISVTWPEEVMRQSTIEVELSKWQ